MSSFKKLIQPECGAPNPLVAAANQLNATSMLPGVGTSHQIFSKTRGIGDNLVGEFLSKEMLLHQQKQQQQQLATQNVQDNFNLNNMIATQPNRMLAPMTNNPIQYQWADQYLNSRQVGPNAQWDKEFLAKTSAANVVPSITPSTSKQQLPHQSHSIAFNDHYLPVIASTLPQVNVNNTLEQVLQSFSNSSTRNKTEDVSGLQQKLQDLQGPSSEEMNAQPKQKEVHNQPEKIDDMDFWADLARKTLPASKDIDSLSSDIKDEFSNIFKNDYIFDDTNPLKDNFEDPLSEGIKKLEQGDIPSAVLLFEAAVQKEANNSLAWRYLGTTQAQNENDSQAIKALKECCRLDANDLVARLALAVSLSNETQHRNACIQLIEWISRNPAYEDLMKTRNIVIETEAEVRQKSSSSYGFSHIKDGEYELVKEVFVAAARISPNNPDPEVQCALGVLFNLRGEYLKAVDCFKAALSVRPEDSLLWNRLGATLANGNRSEEAVSAYRRALKLSPGFLRSRYNLAVSCINLNSYKEAAEQLVTVLNIQAAGRGLHNSKARLITSTNVWNTLRTVVTLLNRPDLYSYIDGRDLTALNREFLPPRQENTT